MHQKLIKTGFRYTDENFENWFTKNNSQNFLNKAAYYIGWIIINLNELEDIISICTQELLNDQESTEELYFIFQSELTYSGKANALIKIYGWHLKHLFEGKSKEKMKERLFKLQALLNEAAEIRNQYAHANWHEISKKRFVRTRTKSKIDGVYHWFRKFSIKEMKKDLTLIEKTTNFLDKFDGDFDYELQKWIHR